MSAEAIGWGHALVHRLFRVRFRRTGGRLDRIIMSDPARRPQTVTRVKDRHGLLRRIPARRARRSPHPLTCRSFPQVRAHDNGVQCRVATYPPPVVHWIPGRGLATNDQEAASMGAGHDHGHAHGAPTTGTAAAAYRGRLRIALAITLTVMVVEIVGGIARRLARADRGRGAHGDGRAGSRHGAARDPLREPPAERQPHLRLRPRRDPRRARQLSAAARRRRIRPVRGDPAVRHARARPRAG